MKASSDAPAGSFRLPENRQDWPADCRAHIELLEAECERRTREATQWREQCEHLTGEIRYRLGDALVRACIRVPDLVALPLRLGRLLVEALTRGRDPGDSADERRSVRGSRSRRPEAAGAIVEGTLRAPALQPMFAPATVPLHQPRSPVRAAVILDEFSRHCLRDELHLIAITPDDWKQRLEADRPDLLLVESVWRGNTLAWRTLIEHAERPDTGPLAELVQECRARGLPTVFWNKEDPPNFKHFIGAASLFDHIFTTDSDCISRYCQHVGHDRVAALPFAVAPSLHHPIGSSAPREGTVCFAGTWYKRKHADRRADLDQLLRPALAHGLHIFDRMHHHRINDSYRFPDEYQPAIQGTLTYPEMVTAYKKYRVFLNVNSVSDSPTMLSRRVLELLACGTAIISSPSRAIEHLLGTDVVGVAETAEEARQWLVALLENRDQRDQMVLRGQRRIFREHTYANRVSQILDAIGLPFDRPRRQVAVIGHATATVDARRILESYARQTFEPKSLILLLEDGRAAEDLGPRLGEVPNVTCLAKGGPGPGFDLLRVPLEASGATHISVFDPHVFYGRQFLTDLMSAFVYADADIVGKAAHFSYDPVEHRLSICSPDLEHTWVERLPASGFLSSVEAFERVWRDREQTERLGGVRASAGLKLYSADRFNYVVPANREDGLASRRIVAFVEDFRPLADV